MSFAHEAAEALTAAIVRQCICGARFVKVEGGCNKVACTCGRHICYVCQLPVNSYLHFCACNNPAACKSCHLYDTPL